MEEMNVDKGFSRTLRFRYGGWQNDDGADDASREQVGLRYWAMLKAKPGQGLG